MQVHSDRDQFLGFAYVNPHTLIAARIVGRDRAYPLDASLLVHRLRVALALRERLYREPYYRLVFGESDGLPGLVLDRYGDVIVGQIATAGMDRAARRGRSRPSTKVVGAATLVWKNDSGARELEGLAKVVGVHANDEWAAAPDELDVREAGLRLRRAAGRRARRPAGSTIRPPIAQRLRALSCRRARACSTCAATWAPGRSPR